MPRRRTRRRAGEPSWTTRRSVHLRALGALDEPLDLLVREAGELARLFCDGDRDEFVLAILAGAPEVEALVDRVLELDGLAPAFGVAARELVPAMRSVLSADAI